MWTSRNHVGNHVGSQKPHISTRFCGDRFTVLGTNVGRGRWISPTVVEPDSRTEPINSHYSGLIWPMNARAASSMRRHLRRRLRAIRRRGGACRPQRRRRRRRLFPPPAPSARLGGRHGKRGRKADRASVVGGLCGPHRRRQCVGPRELPVVRARLALPQQQSGPVASLVSTHQAEVLTAHIRALFPVLVVVTVGEHYIKQRETVPLHGLLLTWHPVHRQNTFTCPSLS